MSHIDFLKNGWEHRTREGMQWVKPLRAIQAYAPRLHDQNRINGKADHGLHMAFQYPIKKPNTGISSLEITEMYCISIK